tara:strand:+ start:154 stop:378 length:225 start_codon:yes stop_codon:yes gene_type:complete
VRFDTKLRIAGSLLEIAGFFVVLYLNIEVGLLVHMSALLVTLPYYVRTSSWDVVLLLTFILCVSGSKLMALNIA